VSRMYVLTHFDGDEMFAVVEGPANFDFAKAAREFKPIHSNALIENHTPFEIQFIQHLILDHDFIVHDHDCVDINDYQWYKKVP